MRTKTLLLAVAAFAVGLASSQADPVYSANVVGYVTQPLNKGFKAISNPLDNGNNSLTNLLYNPVVGGNGGPNGGTGPLDFTLVYIWNGAGYTIYTLDSTFSSGVADASDSNEVNPPPTVAPGQVLYFFNNTSSAVTNVITGTVHVEGGQTGSNIGASTNVLTTGYNFVASKSPVAGGIVSALQLPNTVVGGNGGPNGGTGALDFALLYLPNINGAGQFLGYNIVTLDTTFATGFGDASDSNPVSEPIIPVGGGFILFNNTGHSVQWTQQF